jgi:glutathione S-transferase
MSGLQLFAHPFSSYCQKVLIALYENHTPFGLRMLGPDDADNLTEFARLWPLAKFPLLLDGERAVAESSIIIEYLQIEHPGAARMIPDDADAALETRMLDRIFDAYVMTPLQKIVFDAMRPQGSKDSAGVADARALLDKSYAWLDTRLAGHTWANGGDFSLADCAAAPSLFYADWAHPIGEAHAALRAYRARLLQRPSFARAVDEARPYRHLFPLGAPNRD